ALAHTPDVGTRAACEGVIDAATTRFGRVDLLVNNAGISLHRNAAETSVDEIERIMAVNFFAAVHLTMAALPGMLERRQGSVVNITSVAARVPNGGESAYGAAKAALARWSHGLAVDLHDTGVHVGEIAPGPIDTEIWDTVGEIEYRGKLYPPQVVADAVARMVERGQVFATVPRQYGAVGVAYPIVGPILRWGLRRYEAAAQARGSRPDGHG